MSRELEPEAWVIDDTGFPKFGKHSVGVARQYSGALGKVGNCQIGVSVNAASDAASCPLDWRLFIPEEWDEDSEFNQDRRAKCKLPEDVHHVEKWRLALEMIVVATTVASRGAARLNDLPQASGTASVTNAEATPAQTTSGSATRPNGLCALLLRLP